MHVCLSYGGSYAICHNTDQNTSFMNARVREEWGDDSGKLMASVRDQSFERHHKTSRKCVNRYK